MLHCSPRSSPRRTFHSLLLTLLPASVIFLVAACSGDRPANASAASNNTRRATSVRRQVVIAPPSRRYAVVAVTNPGSVTGTAQYAGVMPADLTIQFPGDQTGCGKPLTVRRIERRGNAVANTLIWISDIRAGRALPLERRFELTNRDCDFDPRMQAVVTGGTLNVGNDDPLVETGAILDVATADTAGILPFTDAGQVIPFDRLLRTGSAVFEVAMDNRPRASAWVAVFDQPYFAVTGPDGGFRIEGVPPGTYTVKAWHPALGAATGRVTVVAGQQAQMALTLPGG